jgi:hypothetical protein
VLRVQRVKPAVEAPATWVHPPEGGGARWAARLRVERTALCTFVISGLVSAGCLVAPSAAYGSGRSSSPAVVVSVSATPSVLPPGGGNVTVTGKVQNASSCELKLLSSQSFPVVYSDSPKSCRDGNFSAHVTIGANPSPVRRSVSFDLVARNTTSSSTAAFRLTLAAKLPQVLVHSVQAAPSFLPPSGGQVSVTATVEHATSCQLELLSSQSFPVVFSHNARNCAGGSYSGRVVIGANPSPISRTVSLDLVARNTTSSSTSAFHLTLAAPPPPTTTTTTTVPTPTTTPTTVPLEITTKGLPNGSVGVRYFFPLHARGGSPPYAWLVNNGRVPSGLRLTAKGVVTGTPTVAGDFTVPVEVIDTVGDIQISNLDLVVAGGAAPTATTTTTMTPPPTTTTTAPAQETGISVSMSLTAPDGASSTSLSDTYTATASATCDYSDGSSGMCDLPAGTVSWEILGGDDGGNFMYPSTPATDCNEQVGAATATSSCDVTWSTYGDQSLGATYTSSPSAQLEGQIVAPQSLAVQIAAPVDLGATYAYDTYGNTGPAGIGDCGMAAAADWIETTFGTFPSSQEIVSDYWAAEDDYNSGEDAGLTATELFDYWQSNGIGGTSLTGADPISSSDVESELSDGYVLLSSATLPAGYPLGDGQGGGHFWIIVGYSSYGPMIVSWGQEVQISWADFDSWTTGVWALGASQD